jgi:hypothetical protein
MSTAVTGTDVLRNTLVARNKKINLGGLARDLGLPSSVLDDFIAGRCDLAPQVKQALTARLFDHAEFDPTLDRLRPANRAAPKALGVAPPPFAPGAPLPVNPGGARLGQSLRSRALSTAAKLVRPGWSE